MRRNSFDNFDKRMNTFQTIFWIMFVIVAIFIVGIIALQVFIGVKIAQNPTGAAEQAGSLLKTFFLIQQE